MQRMGIWMPFLIFIVMIGAFGNQMDDKDPTAPSPQIGKLMPIFSLPRLYDDGNLTQADIQGPALVNVFGSWCAACVEEHPIWQTVRQEVPVYGIAWRDTMVNARKWLDKYGNPYVAVALDQDSTFALDWGITGAPESYLIDENGVIVLKIAGQITPEIWQDNILPRLQAMRVPTDRGQ